MMLCESGNAPFARAAAARRITIIAVAQMLPLFPIFIFPLAPQSGSVDRGSGRGAVASSSATAADEAQSDREQRDAPDTASAARIDRAVTAAGDARQAGRARLPGGRRAPAGARRRRAAG